MTAFSVPENKPVGTVVGLLSATDPDSGDTHTFALVAGAGDTDNASFSIAGKQLKTSAVFNFEVKNSYSIRVRATDSAGLSYDEQFTVSVTNVNETPTDLVLSPMSVDENKPVGTTVGSFSATDPDSPDSWTYSLVAGTGSTNNGSFQISGSELKTKAVFNYEAKSSYSIRVRVTDAGGRWREKQFTITVNNVNDAPSGITLSNASVDENKPSGTVVGALSATDQDSGDTHTFSLVGGAGSTDNASFQIVGSELKTSASLDYEAKSSLSIRIKATDAGGASYEKQFTVTVNNVNEAPTDIALSNTSIDENEPAGTVVGTLSATDPESTDSHTFALVAGTGDADNASFEIVGTELKTKASFNYEVKNSYSIRVKATDSGGLSYQKQLTITVNDVNEAPTDITLSNATVDENKPVGTAVGTLTATDPDTSDSHTFSLVSGTGDADNGSFQIVGDELRTGASFNFEDPNHAATYNIRVRVTDSGSLTYDKQFTITVNDVNEAPMFNDFDSDTPGVQKTISFRIGPDRKPDEDNSDIFDLDATDPDSGATLTYSITSGNPGNLFAIDASTGEITLAQNLSTASAIVYALDVEVKDQYGLKDTGRVTITIEKTSVGVTGDTQAIEGASDGILLKFVRQTSDTSAPLTVQFDVYWSSGTLSPADFSAGSGLTTLQSKSIVIPAGQTEATIELFAPIEQGPGGAGEGLEKVTVEVLEATDYAVVRGAVDPKDPKFKKGTDLFPSAELQVLDKVALFVDGTPGSADGSQVHENDVIQGHVGDCYFLAAVAALARTGAGQAHLQQSIVEDTATQAPYDYKVTFYDGFGSPYIVNVDLELDRGFDAAQLSGDFDATGVEVWTMVLERAYAQNQGGYGNIDNGGSSAAAWELLTGRNGTSENLQGPFMQDTDAQIAQKIQNALNAGNAVMVGTLGNASSLVGDHAYVVTGVVTDPVTGAITKIKFYNPHGYDQELSVDQLNENLETLYIGY